MVSRLHGDSPIISSDLGHVIKHQKWVSRRVLYNYDKQAATSEMLSTCCSVGNSNMTHEFTGNVDGSENQPS